MSARGARLVLAAGALAGLVLTVWMGDRSVPQPGQLMRSEPPAHTAEEESASAPRGRAPPSPESGDLAGPALQGLGSTSTGIRGRVIDSTSGVGISGARVRASRRHDDEFLVDTESDADGSFAIDVPDARFATLWVWHAAYGAPEIRELGRASAARVLIKLTPVETLGGRVVDDRGNPMAGVRVRLEQDSDSLAAGLWADLFDGEPPPLPIETRTDSSGHFAVAACQPDWGPLYIAPLQAGWASRWSVVPMAGSEASRRTLVLTMVRGATLAGRVSMDGLGLLPGCLVSAAPNVWYESEVGSELLPWAHDRLRCHTDAEGRFKVAGVPPDAARLYLWLMSSPSWLRPYEWLISSLSSDQVVDGIEIVVPFDLSVGVTVLGPGELPLRGEQLALVVEGDEQAALEWAVTDAEGRVVLTPRQPHGLQLVRRMVSGRELLLADVDPLAGELTVQASPSQLQWLSVECVQEDGKPSTATFIARARSVAQDRVASSSSDTRGDAVVAAHSVGGRASLPILGPLPVEVSAVTHSDGASAHVLLEAWPEDSTVRLQLAHDLVIHARVADGRDRPVAGLAVSLVPVGPGEQTLTATTDVDGWFTATAAGERDWYSVVPVLDPDSITVGAWSLFAGLPDPTLRIARLGQVSGRLVGAEPRHLAGLTISAVWEASGREQSTDAISDEEGRFTLHGLPLHYDSLVTVDGRALADRGLAAAQAGWLVRAASEPIDVRVVRSRSIEGIVRADASTLASIEIEVWPHDPLTSEPVRAAPRNDGSFQVSLPSAGPWTVAAFVRTGVEPGDEDDSRLLAAAKVIHASDGTVELVVPTVDEIEVNIRGVTETAWFQVWSGSRLLASRLFDLDERSSCRLPVLARHAIRVAVYVGDTCAVGLQPGGPDGRVVTARLASAAYVKGELSGRRLSPTARLAARTATGQIALDLDPGSGWFQGSRPVGSFDLVLTEYFTEEQVVASGIRADAATDLALTVR